ncbi:NAD-dependent epimerase/dehydratase family protein [Priestia aryabhattai]|uniref:NAD-dependent epimerase/dehydratase family protein n=1 Tax=Priestia aryabhattai TaxID=412384 RepID=UPI0020401205|nr:NAD-dependent epimerase/dehydratase family protein [Priestia aryabhattai]MCM3774134.1 NAD-dependent epimerase/dehydratase family protein [Priestia aryabhattai]
MNSLPKLLITGASGFTGQHACIHFLKAGFDITAVTRNNNFNDQIKIEYCDLTDKEAVKKLVKKVKPQYLLHLAGQNHVGQSWLDPLSSLEANFMSTLYLIEVLRQENPDCKIIIVGSALQFDPKDISTLKHPYSLSKTFQVLIAQSWEILYNMDIVIAKPSNLVGPGLSNGVCSIFAEKIVEMEKNKCQKVLEVNNLHAQRDFVDVRDVIRAYEILFKKGKSGEVYEVASGKSHSLEEVTNQFRHLTDVDFKINSQVNNHHEESFEINCLKIQNLGWKPRISLESSLSDIVTFYRNNVMNTS